MSRYILGLDPGLTGAVACLDSTGRLVGVHDMPITSSSGMKRPDGAALDDLLLQLTDGDPGSAMAYVERAQALPRQSSSAGFNYGVGFGVLLAVLEIRGVPFEFVSPAAWKKAAQLSKDKKASLHAANRLFPGTPHFRLAKHDGRAESCLIARHGWLKTRGEVGKTSALELGAAT